ncbi:MAG: HAD-IC family P-type ATPase [Patescibacteria group bacterium]
MSFSEYTNKNENQVLLELKSDKNGLTKTEAKKRQKQNKQNEINNQAPNGLTIFWRQFCSPFIYILLLASGLSFFMGERIDSYIILGIVLLNTLLGFFQEYHSAKSLYLLKKILTHRARVIRDSEEILINSEELVIGDIIKLVAGDIVPADLRITNNNGLIVDESILTGESIEIAKNEKPLKKSTKNLYQAQNILFSGTKVICGEALAVVIAMGANTVMGGVSKLTVETNKKSLFEKNIYQFSKFILQLILITIVLIFVANLLIKGESARIMEILLFSIALAVGVIPEALPLVTTLSLSKGALRLAKNKVIVRRLSAVEDLGGIEILCTDKTGTITENIMQIVDFNSASKEFTLLLAGLASEKIKQKNHDNDTNNSFDHAIWGGISKKIKAELNKFTRIAEIPFSPERRRNSVLVKNNNKKELIVRGAVEFVLPLCHNLTEEKITELSKWQKKQGLLGRRVIALAYKNFSHEKYTVKNETDFLFGGLISLLDPIKKTTREAIKKAEALGVQIKILTGDSREVAVSVGQKIGILKNENQVLTGDEFCELSPEKQLLAVQTIPIFARVSPEQKFQIIEKLQKTKNVGYLGEGINDAPALKLANVSMVVDHACDIARDSADIVLLNPDLNVIIDSIKSGREIFSNIVKYLKITLISNFGNFFALAVSSLFIPYLPMLTVQILLLNLLSDAPMISIASDNIDREEIKKPKQYGVHEVISISLVLGLISTIFDFLFFAIFMKHNPEELQTAWFLGSVLTEIALIYSVRTKHWFWQAKRPSKTVLIPTIFAVAMAFLLTTSSFGQRLFHFQKPSTEHLLIILLLVSGYFIVSEILKKAYYRKVK